MTYETLINTMQDFLLNEPSGDFQLLDDKIRLCKYNGLDEHDIKRIAEVANGFDRSGNLTLIYLASLCRRQIEDTVAPVTSLLCDVSTMDKYRKCLECVNSHEVKGCRAGLVDSLAIAISSVSAKKVLGRATDIDAALDGAIDDIFKEFEKLKFEVYAKSGHPVGTMNATAMSVQVCGSLAECLIRLEKSKDGIYICFISNPGTLDGWFGFFVKSNGNLFSYNERIDEAYAGQHCNMRNGRYAEYGKAYGLFPYELCEFSEETDYKGYSTEVKIGENCNLFDGKNLEMAVRVFLTMALISQKHNGQKVEGECVIVNSLLQMNLSKLEGEREKSKALVVWNGSPIVKATEKFAIPRFEDEKVVRGEYDGEFNGNEGDCGVFCGNNQDILDAYGEGFHADYEKVLASGSSRRLLGDGQTEQEFIGSPHRMRLQAYYEVRKQLAKHVWKQMKGEYDAFGGAEGLEKWYRDRLAERMDTIYRYCIAVYNETNGNEGDVEFGVMKRQDNSPSSIFATQTQPMSVDINKKFRYAKISLSEFKDRSYRCAITGAKASFVFGFNFYSYTQVRDFLNCPLPKFCTGWLKDRPYNGNSILEVTDPVGELNHPISENEFPFNFTIALSKTAIKNLKKECLSAGVKCAQKGSVKNPEWDVLMNALYGSKKEGAKEQ